MLWQPPFDNLITHVVNFWIGVIVFLRISSKAFSPINVSYTGGTFKMRREGRTYLNIKSPLLSLDF
jgi:hypothetical protein